MWECFKALWQPPTRLSSIQVILYTASEIVYTDDNTTGYEYEEEQGQKQ